MKRRGPSGRPALITTAPETPAEELGRRKTRYAIMAVIFVGCFSLAAVLHRDTAVALLLCAVATATLVLAVIGANVRSPRRTARPVHVANDQRQLRSAPAKRAPEE
jgi:DUF3099 family protein